VLLAATALAAAVAVSAQAQSGNAPPRGGKFETRAGLEARAQTADSLGRADEAAAIRRRLAQGDFEPGDRLLVLIEGDQIPGPDGVVRPPIPDTVVVRDGRMIQLRTYAPLSLAGVLRAEAHERILKHVGETLVSPSVRVVPLMRVGVLGSVARPSYYYLPPDGILTDAIAAAGGYGGDADPTRITIRREGRQLYSRGEVDKAKSEGRSLDGMNLQAGDEIVVERRSTNNWVSWMQLTLGVVVAVIGIASARR
jgi:protein involved in polysaccharide export with SLBB domain